MPEERLYSPRRWLSVALAGLIVVGSGLVLLLGWIAGYGNLTRVGTTSGEMAPSTAIAFILLGSGLMIWWTRVHRGRSRIVAALSAVAALLVLVELLTVLAGGRGGIGALILGEWNQSPMSHATMLQFLLGSYCLAALSQPRLWNQRAFAVCATSGLLLSLVAVVGHAFDTNALSGMFLFSAMAPHTAINAAMLHAALLLKRPQATWVGLLFEPGSGSVIARRLLPLAVLGPFLLCLGTLGLVRAGMFNVNFQLSLLTIALTSVSSLAILRNAAVANRAERAALHDRLTGLPNRELLIEELSRAIARASESHAKVGLVFLDLDRFNTINQVLGDAIGDAVLRSVSTRMAGALAETDTLARIGGDEFAVVVPDRNSREEIETSARRFREALMRPATVNGGQIETSASFGVAVYPDDAADAMAVRRHADLAVWACKANGRRSICYFHDELEAAALQRAQVESDLRVAIEQNALTLEYQPLFDLASGRIGAVEALVRWRHAERGIIPPADFIPIAEESGLIRPLGHWILSQACAQQAAWSDRGFDLKVAVNVSPAETAYDDYPEVLLGALDAAGVDGAGIELEITEGLLIEHESPSVKNFLRACEARGVGLAIDDFGTGYSSLSYLGRLPVSTIKIDRSFVGGLGRSGGRALVEALVGVGHSLDKRIVAEGIEAESQLKTLQRMGCHDAQGYFLSPPLGVEGIEVQLQAASA